MKLKDDVHFDEVIKKKREKKKEIIDDARNGSDSYKTAGGEFKERV